MHKSIWIFLLMTIFITCVITTFRYKGIDLISNQMYLGETPLPEERDGTCSPKYNVVYAKLAKTGSSTLQNILARKAFNENVFVGSPNQKRPAGATKHMIFNRMPTFQYEKLSVIVPADTIYIGLLRDPLSHFESTLYYFHDIVPAFRRANNKDLLRDYLENANKYYRGRADGERWHSGKNPLTYELGYDVLNETDEYIQNTVRELDSRLDLVMMTEQYDISLLLLRDLLCWNMEDVVYLPLNSRKKSEFKPLDSDLREKVYEWNKIDTALHKHFNATFWKRVEQYGIEKMGKELSKFQKMKKNMYSDCIEEEKTDKNNVKHLILRNSPKNKKLCEQLLLSSAQWIKEFSKRENFI